jgi:hypothetical protein
MADTIDLTPTWAGILPYILAGLEEGAGPVARQVAQEEIQKMARIADEAGEMLKTLKIIANRMDPNGGKLTIACAGNLASRMVFMVENRARAAAKAKEPKS